MVAWACQKYRYRKSLKKIILVFNDFRKLPAPPRSPAVYSKPGMSLRAAFFQPRNELRKQNPTSCLRSALSRRTTPYVHNNLTRCIPALHAPRPARTTFYHRIASQPLPATRTAANAEAGPHFQPPQAPPKMNKSFTRHSLTRCTHAHRNSPANAATVNECNAHHIDKEPNPRPHIQISG